MKKTSLFLLILLIVIKVTAQVPQAMNYQAIARTSAGDIIPSQPIGVRFTITDAAGTTIFYQEKHSATTNNFGLFTLAIGKGTAISGAIAPIDWGTGGDKYLKVEIDPQGGSNYTMQGLTQLISVPYALYSEKTKLVGGNAISITNGNTIDANYQAGNAITITGNTISGNYQAGNAITITGNIISGNYQAGAGISITGNTISSTATAANAWLLTGNAGTTAANFLGTTDNQPLSFRTNNITRMHIDKSTTAFGADIGNVFISDETTIQTNPAQFVVYGRDIAGASIPEIVVSSVSGATWGIAGGNTLGRLMRFSQMTTASYTQSQFYDLGIRQDSTFYISGHGLQNVGGLFPKPVITISAQDNVGINMAWTQKPTANFHSRGTARFEGLGNDNTQNNVLVTDNNGNVFTRAASTLGVATNNSWLLLGNSGTSSAINFVGTTDNQPLNFRTNNIRRMYLDNSVNVFGADLTGLHLSDEASVLANPAQLSVFGRDIAGASLPALIVSYVAGATWGIAGGNTLGRFLRLSQMTTGSFVQSHFYDLGMTEDSSLYFSNHGFQNVGGIFPKRMITISAQDNVGINMAWTQKPTANFHTRGTARFEGLANDNTQNNVLVTDNNGNVFTRAASTLGVATNNSWLLLGNSGTNSAVNFIGSTDNQGLSFRTNNITRMYLDNSINAFGADLTHLSLSDDVNVQVHPAQLNVFGRDMAGANMPALIVSYVSGSTWGVSGGNTLGRIMRFSQMSSPNIAQSHFYDLGIGQDSSFFLTNHGFQSVGGIFPKQMITISAQDNVGINMAWAQKPTANFHTKGTARFEGLANDNTQNNVLVTDNNGNVFTRAASTLGGSANSWLLPGNSGTNSAINFVGTTDDQPLSFRTNNIIRMHIDKSTAAFGADIGNVFVSDETTIQANPAQFVVYGRDIAGAAIPEVIVSSVSGATWGVAGGNTSGRLMRFSQMTTPIYTQSQFYDLGIRQDSTFYISGHGLQNVGGLLPKPVITISAQDNVGINMAWTQKPTANFHTNGSLRFQGITTDNTLTRILAMDINGNVFSRDASTLTGSGYWLPDANGIYYSSGSVGIGTNSSATVPFSLMGTQSSTYTAQINSSNDWQTAVNLYNTTSNWRWSITTGGSANNLATYGVGEGNFGIANDNNNSLNTTFPILITKDDKVGIGMGLGGTNNEVKAQLHIKTGDIYIEQIGAGVIMKSPNGQCWRMTVSDTGTPVFTAIACP